MTIASYIRTLKEHAKNRSISMEEFARAVFEIVISRYDIRNQRGDPLDLNKSRISKIMTGKVDVPEAIRSILVWAGVEEDIKSEFEYFSQDYLDSSALTNIVEKLSESVKEDTSLSEQARNSILQSGEKPIDFLALTFLAAIKSNNTITKPNNVLLWSCGNSSVELIAGDLFKFGFDNRYKSKNIVVIPVNTAFDTQISFNAEKDLKPVVSENTIHGQWIRRMLQSGLTVTELENRIKTCLLRRNSSGNNSATSEPNSLESYPIGSIAVIESQKAIYYLLAVSQFDENNVAHSTTEDIKNAILCLLRFYDQNGQGCNMYMPLVGTGRSRAGMDYKDSLDAIKSVFDNNSSLIHGKITIVAQPDVMNKLYEKEGKYVL